MTDWLIQNTQRFRVVLICVVAFSLLCAACERRPEPIQIGMIASLTGRTADIGVAARDGAIQAIEQINREGGVHGRPVELVVRDVGNDPEQARLAVRELADQGVIVTIGPVLSSMALAMTHVADEVGMLLLSPTVSTDLLSTKDDLFLRVHPPCSETAHALAEYVYEQQHRRFAVIAEQSNKAFTDPWQKCFNSRFEKLGGTIAVTVDYVAGANQSFLDLTAKAIRDDPDGLLILGSAIDVAMIAQQVAKERAGLPIFVSEWSLTRNLLAHGGRSVEGIKLYHAFNEQSKSSRYVKFVEDFAQRFGRKPSFASVHAYDATGMALLGLMTGAKSGSELKRELLKIREFEALQSTLRLDQFGDVDRALYLTEVRNGDFSVIREQRR